MIDEAAHQLEGGGGPRKRNDQPQSRTEKGPSERVGEKTCVGPSRLLQRSEQRHVLSRTARLTFLHATSRLRDACSFPIYNNALALSRRRRRVCNGQAAQAARLERRVGQQRHSRMHPQLK